MTIVSRVGLDPVTHGLRAKCMDLSTTEVRYSHEIREWYFAVTMLPEILLSGEKDFYWAGATATVNAALPFRQVSVNMLQGQTYTVMFPLTSTSRLNAGVQIRLVSPNVKVSKAFNRRPVSRVGLEPGTHGLKDSVLTSQPQRCTNLMKSGNDI